MVMKMNCELFLNQLMEKTNDTRENCMIIYDILNHHGIIGRNSKTKIMNDFMKKLCISQENSNKLYNICMELKLKDFFTQN